MAEISEDERTNAHQIISNRVKEMISPITKPDLIMIVNDLPKTRSGKIMKRVLRKIMSSPEAKCGLEDMATISNPECLDEIMSIVMAS
jgi:acetyl-CoA synthetase